MIHFLEVLGKKIAECCRGLPLAIVVIGGILATKKEPNEWKFVYQNIKSFLGKGENFGEEGEIQKILRLSYNDLPYQLKTCFLYLSIYPEDCNIETETLYQLWMAERMVSEEHRIGGESMMDVAERYLGELVKRSMIQVRLKDRPALRKFESCQLHDLMRDMCLAKPKDENFTKITDYREGNNLKLMDSNSSTSSIKCQRMVVFLNEDVSKYVPPKREVAKYVRSLKFCILRSKRRVGNISGTQFNNMKLLRALTIEGFDSVPKDIRSLIQTFKLEIGDLIHLRYLCMRDSNFVMLPSSLGNLEHLETLDLRGCDIGLIRNVLWKMKNLKYVYLSDQAEPESPKCCKFRLFGLTKLEILEYIGSSVYEIKDLCKLRNVQVLKALQIYEESECEEIINYISDSQCLKEARLEHYMNDGFLSSEKWLTLVEKLFGSNLCHLSLVGQVRVLPEYKIHFFPNLVELELYESRIEINLMGALEKLPSLHSLWLRTNAFDGRELICSGTGFPQLRFLLLEWLNHLEEWRLKMEACPTFVVLKLNIVKIY